MISACSAGAPWTSFCKSCKSSVSTAAEAAFLSTTGGGGRTCSRGCVSVAHAEMNAPTTATIAPAVSRSSGVRMCLLLRIGNSIGIRPHRHGDSEMGTWVFAVHDLHGAAVRGHEFQHDGEPDAGTFDRGALRCPSGVESFKNMR